MKRFFLILALLALTTSAAQAAETDSTITIGKFRLSVEYAQLGAIIGASTDPNTMCEAKPFAGSGLNFQLAEIKGRYGVNVFTLFYTDGEKIYPMAALGITLLAKRFAVGYDFGSVTDTFDKTYKGRVKVIVSFNPF